MKVECFLSFLWVGVGVPYIFAWVFFCHSAFVYVDDEGNGSGFFCNSPT